MKITEDVGSDAAEQGLAEEKALKKGMQKNPASSRRAASFTRRRDFQVFLPATQALENLKTKNHLTILPVVHIHTMPKKLDMSAMENCVCFNLRWVTRVVTQFFDAEMRRHGIRPTQGTILASLKTKDS